jgi:hypothetical protein
MHSGLDTSEWVYTGSIWVRSLRSTDHLPGADSAIFATKYDVDTAKSNLRVAINQKIGLTNLSASSPLVYNNSTGAFSCPTCAVGSSGISSLNGLTASTQTFVFDQTGTNFGVTSSGSTHTFHAPILSGIDTGVATPAMFNTWNAKQNAITTGTTLQYFRGDLSLATFPTRLSQFTNDAGYITNNQPISFTATGDVTGTYTNPTTLNPTLTIGNNKVTYAKIQAAVGAQVLLGAQSAGNYQEITLGSGLSMVGGVLSSTGGGGSGNTNSNIGAGFRWAVPNTNNIKTFFVVGGTLDSSSNSNALTLTIPTYINQLTGDGAAGPGGGSQIFTLATVNSNVGTFGSATQVGQFTVNGKGLITAASSVSIQIAESQVTNLTTDLAGKQGALSNTGTGFRIFSPQTGIKTLFCVGCTLDSTTNANALTLTVTGGTGINQLTGDGTAGPGSGSQVFTLATVNSNVGTFGSATQVGQFTVNGKGLITAASSISIQIAESQVTNLTTDLAGKQGALSNIGSGFRIFSPQTGIKTLFCVGCTLDSTTNANALTLTVTGGGSGTVTNFSFTNGNGFTGTVTNASTTPALSLAPSFTGIANSNGSALSALSGTGYLLQATTSTSFVSGSATNLIGYNASGTGSAIILGSNLSMVGNTLSATGGVPSLTSGHIFIGNASNVATDTAFVNDIMQMQEIAIWNPGLGLDATADSIAGFGPKQVDSILFYYTSSSGITGISGGWLTNSTSGDSIEIGPPFCVIIGNSLAAGHKSHVGRLETGGGVGGFISNYPDSAGQLSYEFRSLTNMRWYNQGIGGQNTTQIRLRFLRDAIGLVMGVSPDGRPTATLPRKPAFILIEGAINDFFTGVPLQTTKNNILWMVEMCKEFNIPCAIYNSPGDAISNQQQLGWIKNFNDWLASGILAPYNCYVVDMNTFWNDPTYGNDNIHHIADISDDIHFTPTGYHNLAIYTFQKAHLPVLDSIQFITAIAPTGGITNYARPTSTTIGRGTPYSATYTLANSPTVTVAVTAPVMDSTWFLINSSTTVVGAGTQTGFSSVLFHLGNNPTHQIWRTQKSPYAGGFTNILNSTHLNIIGSDGGGDTTIDIRLADGVNRSFQLFTNNGGSVFYFNGLGGATRYNNSVVNINVASGSALGTNGSIFSSATHSQLSNIEFNTNSRSTTTGFGISVNNTGGPSVRFEGSAVSGGDDFSWEYWNSPGTNTKAVTASAGANINHYHFPLGWASFQTINQTANTIYVNPVLNNTASFSGSIFAGITYDPTITSLNGARHIGLWIKSGQTVLSSSVQDHVMIGTATDDGTDAILQINGKVALDVLPDSTAVPTGGILYRDPTDHKIKLTAAAGGSGTVTSVAFTAPTALFTVSGSPITNSGTIAATLTTAAANTVWTNNTGSTATPAYGKMSIATLATGTANRLIGFDGSGNPTGSITASNGLFLSSGVLFLGGTMGNRNIYATDGSGNPSWTDPLSISGSWTVSASTNVSTVSLVQFVAVRTGTGIHVTLSGNVTATASGSATAITVNLPVGAQAAVTTSWCGGGSVNGAASTFVTSMVSVTSSSTAEIDFTSNTTSSVPWVVSFDYFSN